MLTRSVFERGLTYCGTDYLGHGLWDKYIQYEEELGMRTAVCALYCRAIACPLKELDKYFNGCVRGRLRGGVWLSDVQSCGNSPKHALTHQAHA